MSFYNPYMSGPDFGQGISDFKDKILALFSMGLLGGGRGGAPSVSPTSVGGGTSGPMGGMAGNNIMKQAPSDFQQGPSYQPPQPNMIPQGASLGQTGVGQANQSPDIRALLAYLSKMGIKV